VLDQAGINTLWAKNGEESIKLCQDNNNIDLVLMDINMSIMNGYEATQKIKTFRPDLPIIAQIAFAIADDRQKSLDAGCDKNQINISCHLKIVFCYYFFNLPICSFSNYIRPSSYTADRRGMYCSLFSAINILKKSTCAICFGEKNKLILFYCTELKI